MAVLTLPSFGDVALARDGASEDIVRVGDFDRAFSGAARSSSRGEFKVWTLRTVEYDWTDAESIRDEMMGAQPITVTGDLPGGSVDVVFTAVSITLGSNGSTLTGVVSFTMEQDQPS